MVPISVLQPVVPLVLESSAYAAALPSVARCHLVAKTAVSCTLSEYSPPGRLRAEAQQPHSFWMHHGPELELSNLPQPVMQAKHVSRPSCQLTRATTLTDIERGFWHSIDCIGQPLEDQHSFGLSRLIGQLRLVHRPLAHYFKHKGLAQTTDVSTLQLYAREFSLWAVSKS